MQKQLSPENYIRTKARQLPIYKCYINESWEEGGLASIIVSRKHNNGNFTIGLYLVDIYCLGLKESSYYFNIPDFEFDNIKDSLEEDELIIETDYPLVHNIIYGGIEFADDYEFKPHKSFKLTQYILEEDTDAIDLIEIPFGIDGKPAVLFSPNEFPTHIVAHLESVAGPGNYSLINVDDINGINTPDYEFDHDFEDTGELLDDYSGYTMEELIERFETEKDNEDTSSLFGLVFELFVRLFDENGNKYELICEQIQSIEANFHITSDYTIPEIGIVPENETLFFDLQKTVFDINPNAIDECLKAIEATPHPSYYSLLVTAYQHNEQFDKADEMIKNAFELYPDNPLTRINYAFYLVSEMQFDKLELFMSGFDISRIVTDRETIHLTEITGIYHLACIYYAETNQHLKSAAYQKCYDMLEDLADELFDKKLELFEYLCMKQLVEINLKTEQFK